MIELATVSDARYLPWCATLLGSAAAQHVAGSLRVHLLHDGSLSTDAQAQLQAFAEVSGFALCLYAVPIARVQALASSNYFGSIIWLRLLLPELLAAVPRVLYLDADTFIADSLTPLWNTDLPGQPLAAVRNVLNPAHQGHLAALGLHDASQYFNSGVLLLDLERCRRERWQQKLLDCAATQGKHFQWPDQDSLNVVFKGQWHSLHPRWNCQNTLFFERTLAAASFGAALAIEAAARPAILHFEGAGIAKPWHLLSPHPWAGRYRERLAKTPWAGTPLSGQSRINRLIARLPQRWQTSAYLRVHANLRRLGLANELP